MCVCVCSLTLTVLRTSGIFFCANKNWFPIFCVPIKIGSYDQSFASEEVHQNYDKITELKFKRSRIDSLGLDIAC